MVDLSQAADFFVRKGLIFDVRQVRFMQLARALALPHAGYTPGGCRRRHGMPRPLRPAPLPVSLAERPLNEGLTR